MTLVTHWVPQRPRAIDRKDSGQVARVNIAHGFHFVWDHNNTVGHIAQRLYSLWGTALLGAQELSC